MRCLYLDRRGLQCPLEALEGSEFCADHRPISDAEETESTRSRPFAIRLVALVLLLMILYNAYHTVLEWLGH